MRINLEKLQQEAVNRRLKSTQPKTIKKEHRPPKRIRNIAIRTYSEGKKGYFKKADRKKRIVMAKVEKMSPEDMFFVVKELRNRWYQEIRIKGAEAKYSRKVVASIKNRLTKKAKLAETYRHRAYKNAQSIYKKDREITALKKEIKQLIEEKKEIMKMRPAQFKKTIESVAYTEFSKRNPRALRPVMWARILHRTSMITRSSELKPREVYMLMYASKREYVNAKMFAIEMNENKSIFFTEMRHMKKKGYAASEKVKGDPFTRFFLTPQGESVAKQIMQFVTKNLVKQR